MTNKQLVKGTLITIGIVLTLFLFSLWIAPPRVDWGFKWEKKDTAQVVWQGRNAFYFDSTGFTIPNTPSDDTLLQSNVSLSGGTLLGYTSDTIIARFKCYPDEHERHITLLPSYQQDDIVITPGQGIKVEVIQNDSTKTYIISVDSPTLYFPVDTSLLIKDTGIYIHNPHPWPPSITPTIQN